jgi:hypothetical protein
MHTEGRTDAGAFPHTCGNLAPLQFMVRGRYWSRLGGTLFADPSAKRVPSRWLADTRVEYI